MAVTGIRVFRQTSVLTVAACVTGALLGTPAIRGQATLEITPDARQKIDAIVESERARLKLPGLGVAIALNGRIAYTKSSGFADVENRLAVDEDSRFRTASLAKPITATAVMQLVERGVMSLDAAIQQYCPAFPEKPWPVTPRLLLGHLAGIRHYARPGESIGTQHYFTIEDSLALFKKDPLLHEPGTKYEYSTYGFSVLGCAIEGASKMPFAAYLQANVFDKAGMTHTAIDDLFQIVPKRVRGYLLLTADQMKDLPPAALAFARPGSVYNTVLHDTSMKLPGGGLVSTPSDYARFIMALLDHTLVSEATLGAMWTSQKTRDGKETEYGFGFGVQMRRDGKNVSHSGNQAGAASLMRISPERRAALVIMTNLEDAPLGQLANQIGTVVLGSAR
jgi:CubicO group peptidase (beta-lactamase class C family)